MEIGEHHGGLRLKTLCFVAQRARPDSLLEGREGRGSAKVPGCDGVGVEISESLLDLVGCPGVPHARGFLELVRGALVLRVPVDEELDVLPRVRAPVVLLCVGTPLREVVARARGVWFLFSGWGQGLLGRELDGEVVREAWIVEKVLDVFGRGDDAHADVRSGQRLAHVAVPADPVVESAVRGISQDRVAFFEIFLVVPEELGRQVLCFRKVRIVQAQERVFVGLLDLFRGGQGRQGLEEMSVKAGSVLEAQVLQGRGQGFVLEPDGREGDVAAVVEQVAAAVHILGIADLLRVELAVQDLLVAVHDVRVRAENLKGVQEFFLAFDVVRGGVQRAEGCSDFFLSCPRGDAENVPGRARGGALCLIHGRA